MPIKPTCVTCGTEAVPNSAVFDDWGDPKYRCPNLDCDQEPMDPKDAHGRNGPPEV